MPGRRLLLAVSLPLLALAAVAVACEEGEGGTPVTLTPTTMEGNGTATAPAAATPTAGLTPGAQDIRQEDLAAQPGLREFLGSAGGEVRPEAIIYADLTGDGVEDAVAPVSSGGEGGDIAVFVYGYTGGALQELLRALPEEASSIATRVEEGRLVTTEGVYGPGDPLCCPGRLRHRYYRWDGAALAMEREELEDQPDQMGP